MTEIRWNCPNCTAYAVGTRFAERAGGGTTPGPEVDKALAAGTNAPTCTCGAPLSDYQLPADILLADELLLAKDQGQ